MKHLHIRDLHVAERFVEAYERALHHGPVEDPAPRPVPAAADWTDWSWEDGGRRD